MRSNDVSVPTKDEDLARLAEIADQLDERKLLFHEQRLILNRRLEAGDCATTTQPQDRGQGELARICRISTAQVGQMTKPELVEKARKAIANGN